MFSLNKSEGSVILLVAALLVCLLALFSQSKRATEDVVNRAFETAGMLSDFFELTQEHYTINISNVTGVEFTTTPEITSNALMYPATFGRTYTRFFNADHPESQFQIYSNYPFESTRDRQLDEFAQRALETLSKGDRTEMRQIETLPDGRQRVRLAVPIIMREGCVACHNDISWELARHDWKVGDVRGVREVLITVAPTTLYSQTEAFLLFLLMLVSCVLAIFVVYPSVRQEVKSRQHFHELSIQATQSARRSLVQAQTDTLSGLGNRRYFETEFERAVAAALENGKMPSLLMFDIDHFKNVNDKFGHDAGDYALQEFAEILRRNTRSEDKLCRFGGEEFMVILPNIDQAAVKDMALRIKTEVQHAQLTYGDQQFSLTVSVGCCSLQPDDTADTFLKRVDQMLYRAKDAGRNTICWTFDGESGCAP